MRSFLTSLPAKLFVLAIGFTSATAYAGNVAPLATPTASSQFNDSNFSAAGLIDGGTGLGNDWASAGEELPSATLTWDEPVRLESIQLANRRAPEQVLTGTLTFSDGSTLPWTDALPINASFVTLAFPAKVVTSVTFQVDTALNGVNTGLAEFRANGRVLRQPNIAPLATASASSEFNGSFDASKMIDGGEDGVGGRWASSGEQTPDATLTWDEPVILTSIELFDGPPGDNVLAGRLDFSDGSSIDTGEILFDGSSGAPLVVEFFDAPKTVTSVTFNITQAIGVNEGLFEFRARGRLAIEENIAILAQPSVSSQFNGDFAASGIHDGVDGDLNREWASQGETTPNATLTWDVPVRLTSVTLYDRPAPEDIAAGTLTFSDGSTVAVGALPGDGAGLNIPFEEIVTTSVEFQVDTDLNGANVGLWEFEAHGTLDDPPPAPVSVVDIATITVSSEFNSDFGAQNLVDGPGGEWASLGEQTPFALLSWPDTFVQLTSAVLQDRPAPSESILNGTLTFSDGTTVAVGELPNDGAPLDVPFTSKVTQSIRFDADGGVGANVGLLEFGLTGVAPKNLAPMATPTVPSFFNNDFDADNLIDGISDTNLGGEWASLGNDTGGATTLFATLTWPEVVMLTNVRLFDRPNLVEGTNAGTLSFSDGTFIPVNPGPPNDGSALDINFDPKLVTSVTFEMTDIFGPNVGLWEFQAIGLEATNVMPQATSIAASSEFNGDFAAANLIDGFNGIYRDEWASLGEGLPFVDITWPVPVVLSSVVIVDRPNGIERVQGGELRFTDGSVVAFGELPTDGQGLRVEFAAPVTTDTMRVAITQSTGGNVGLREVEAYGILGAPTGPIIRPPPPGTPAAPADNSINVPREASLSWLIPETSIDNVTLVNVYFGTSMDPPLVAELTDITASMSYSVGVLDPTTQYFWRIDTVNNDGITEGTTRNFTTRSAQTGEVPAANLGGGGGVSLLLIIGLMMLLLSSVAVRRRVQPRNAE